MKKSTLEEILKWIGIGIIILLLSRAFGVF